MQTDPNEPDFAEVASEFAAYLPGLPDEVHRYHLRVMAVRAGLAAYLRDGVLPPRWMLEVASEEIGLYRIVAKGGPSISLRRASGGLVPPEPAVPNFFENGAVAERVLEIREQEPDSVYRVTARVSAPQRHGNDWLCGLLLDGVPYAADALVLRGADSLQALHRALDALALQVDALREFGGSVTWPDGSGGAGVPVTPLGGRAGGLSPPSPPHGHGIGAVP